MKKIITLALSVVAMLTSCSKEEFGSSVNPTDQVTINLVADDAAATRSDVTPSTAPTRYIVEAYSDAAYTTAVNMFGTVGSETNQTTITAASGSATLNLAIDRTKDYYFLFWSDVSGDAVYTTTSLKTVMLKDAKNPVESWSGKAQILKGTAEPTLNVTLNRTVARIVLMETGKIPANSSLVVTFDQSAGFNVAEGSVYGGVSRTETIANSEAIDGTIENPVPLNNDEIYVLATQVAGSQSILGKITFTMTIGNVAEDPFEVTSVPLEANKATNITGHYTQMANETFTVGVDESWATPDNNVDVDAKSAVDYSDIATVNKLLGRSDSDLRLSNCYMVDPAEVSTYKIPVGSRINTYWGDSDYDNDLDLLIGTDWTTNSDYTIEPLWNDFSLTNYTDNITFSKVAGTDDNYAMQIDFADGFSYAGNMVVAVKKGETIVWSWHIWITDYNPYTKTNGTTYDISGYGTWMDRNIGARSTAYSASEGNLYYQWGRKDPLRAIGGNSDVVEADVNRTIADVVKAPVHFYLGSNSTGCDWCGSGTEWDQCRAYHWRDAKLPSTQATSEVKYGTTKSIYDPSPLGFMVPGSLSTTNWSSPFEFMSSVETADFNNGLTYSNDTTPIFFPASGRRLSTTGAMNLVGSSGYNWSASPNSSTLGCYLSFSSTNVSPSSINYRANGFPIRPIQE